MALPFPPFECSVGISHRATNIRVIKVCENERARSARDHGRGRSPLLNIYSVMEINPTNGPRVNAVGGNASADFMLTPEAQAVIKTFGIDKCGQPLFVPTAGKKNEDF